MKQLKEKRIYIYLGFLLMVGLAVSIITMQVINAKKSEGVEFVIGMSQANLTEPWRISMNAEIIEEARKYKNIKIVYKDAGGDSDKQKKDINELVSAGVDLLIVSINDSKKLTPLVSQVYKSMPVIVLDRAVEGYDYSLYIGPDNEKIGIQAGNLVLDLMEKKQVKVMEVQGVLNSSPVIARSNGFRSVLKGHQSVNISRTIVSEWQKDEAEDKVTEALQGDKDIDVIFAHNDYMALGAYKAVYKLGLKNIKIIGVDGLTGESGGLDLVSKGIIQGTFTCKTGGKEAVNYAMEILNKKKDIPKKIILKSDKITMSNVNEYLNNKSKNLVGNKDMVLGYAQLKSESRWRDANAKSIKTAAKDAETNSVKDIPNKNPDIELKFSDGQQKQENQIKAIRSFIAQKVEVIALAPVVESGWDRVLVLRDRKVISELIGEEIQEGIIMRTIAEGGISYGKN